MIGMGDIYKEQIVKKNPTTKDTMKKVGLVAAVVLVFFVAVSVIPNFAFVVAIAAGFGAYLLMSRLNVEYEYILTNGELDIDAIYNKTRRKRMFSGVLKDIELMAPANERTYEREFSTATETKDYSTGSGEKGVFAILASYKGKKQKILIEPNELMMNAITSVLPQRKLKKY